MKAFYGDRFSPNMTKTPEGFLICHNVPIARTGVQEYLPHELGLTGDSLIAVRREDTEVFRAATIASFEGKPVTDDHPPTGVDPTNYNTYMRGVVQNAHRGEAGQSDYILADLVIHDANLIAEIETGKREVSCGYDCQYIACGDGSYRQVDIIGNHVAVVDQGRAGPTVSIKDGKPKGEKRMGKNTIWQRMFASFVKDAEPDEIQEAAKAVSDAECGGGDPVSEPPKKEAADEGLDLNQVAAAVAELTKKVDALLSAEKREPEHKDDEISSLDALETELSGTEKKPEATDTDEASVTIPPEKIATDETAPANPEDKKDLPVADTAIALAAIRAMKPIVASLPAEQRQQANDTMSKAIRDAMQVKTTQVVPGAYGAVLKRNTADALDRTAFGRNCLKRNPHYKEEK